jgi:hypothetical protein
VNPQPTPLLEHPAARAWSQVQPTRISIAHIQLVRKRARSTVYRLEGAGPNGVSVIAKRSRRAHARIERILYQHVIPLLPMPSLTYYGFFDETDGDFAWLFIGCSEGEPFATTSPEHRALAARWLSLLHSAGASLAAVGLLPERGPGYFYTHLVSAQRNLAVHYNNAALSPCDRGVLAAVLGQCEALARHWKDVELKSTALPMTLVHGDFAPKNMRVRNDRKEMVLEPYDWGSACWGVAALDLAQADGPDESGGRDWASPDLDVYRASIGARWLDVDRHDLELCAALGKAFRCVYCIDRESEYLGEAWIDKAILNMRLYRSGLGHVLRVTGW